MPLVQSILLILILLVPFVLLLGVVYIRRWYIDRKKERSPISEKLLRPAGESLRLKIEELNERFGPAFFSILAGPGLFLLGVSGLANTGLKPLTILLISTLLGVGAFAWAVIRFMRLANDLRNYNLGFHGERAVAEEINQLMRDGCFVYHDLPMEPYGNIDHVIVASSGVYAVETKTRRKRKAPDGKKDHVVFYDGDSLEYPHCRDVHGLQQAKQQADRLRVFLKKAVGEEVQVTPILTLPGWFITNRVRPELQVVTPKVIRRVVLNHGSQNLSSELMQRIAHQIEQKCRDVEL